MHPEVFEIHNMPDLGLLIQHTNDGLMECVRYNPKGPSKPGILNGMVIKLSTENM